MGTPINPEPEPTSDATLPRSTTPSSRPQPLTRGRLRVFVGFAAGVGKTVRMLEDAHALRARGVDVVIGLVETHGRSVTEARIGDLEVIPRVVITHRGLRLDELDLDAIVTRAPQLVIVDELPHSNPPGMRHAKRYEDVLWLLDQGIDVVTAMNVQHLESVGEILTRELGVTVRETVPDWFLTHADDVVNIDLSTDDLLERLREGRIYPPERARAALQQFFTSERLDTLRELALREVATSVERQRAEESTPRRDEQPPARRADRIVVAMSSNPPFTRRLLLRASRIAGRLNSDWYCVYVRTPAEQQHRMDSATERGLVDNVQMAQRMGAEIVQLQATDVAGALLEFARTRGVRLLVVGQSRRSWWHRLRFGSVIDRLIAERSGLDVLVVSLDDEAP
ncbi:MAG: universal stress protein [Gemmatimonadaceae bacterium]|nr:universal stress protein [Gemmatimonadaceae bacterium]